jgi:DMSO reductase family type II enzyme heme b subunit
MTANTLPRVRATESSALGPSLLNPAGAGWDEVVGSPVSLAPTPLGSQPSAYVQAAWAARPYGRLATARVAAVVAGGSLYLKLSWSCAEPRMAITDNDVFADACAVLFPLDGETAQLATMGDEQHPVEGWHWRAGTALPFVIQARGLGTVTREPHHAVSAGAGWEQGLWSVVFQRELREAGTPLRPGRAAPFGVAIWQGVNSERAGLKSHTPAWITLDIPGGG